MAVVDWCAGLIDAEPVRVLAFAAEAAGLAGVFFECSAGRAIHMSRRWVPGARPALRLRVVAEHGSAAIRHPDRVFWTAASGSCGHRLRGQRPLTETLLLRFHEAVQTGQAPGPHLDETYRALHWLRAAVQSQAEGRPIVLGQRQATSTGG
jgi:hypothetical protein